ncbi:hypothetical protein PFLG_02954 [Plasmodium falciparum RAJ116]|uniref:Uncharacterized protein n=1 Tax=Plasmodium falciparum RAJ116 TaxID=580058 RepID=A0A0L0D0Z1_PLAFA|nr:hypothetical protein PFLG_02954 [Plasmodium falciparum RAJ116]
MICLRHYANANTNTNANTNANTNININTSTNTNINVYKKEENKTIKVKTEIKIKDKCLTPTNESLIQTSSINSNFSNIISVDGFSSINLESHCSQKMQNDNSSYPTRNKVKMENEIKDQYI